MHDDLCACLLLTLPSVFQPTPRASGPASASRLISFRQDLGEGIRWLWHYADIRDLTIAVGVISAMDAAWFAVFVLYMIQILHQRPGAYGLLLAVAALGGIVTAVPIAAITAVLTWRHRSASQHTPAIPPAGDDTL